MLIQPDFKMMSVSQFHIRIRVMPEVPHEEVMVLERLT
jgi:hypothetical protein